MAKHIIKISILVVWVALLGWWWHESRSWPVPEKIEAAFLPNYYDYFDLKFGDQKIGWVVKGLRRLRSGSYQCTQGMTVQVKVMNQVVEIKSNSIVQMDHMLNIVSYQYLVQAGPLNMVESGKVENERLTVNVNLGQHGPILEDILEKYGAILGEYAQMLDFSQDVESQAPTGPGLAQAVPPYLSYLGFEVGRSYSMSLIDIGSRRPVRTNVRIVAEERQYDPDLGREVPVYQIAVGSGENVDLTWADRYGRTLKEESVGFSLARVRDMSEAAAGITPLVPPIRLTSVFKREDLDKLLKAVTESGKARQD